MPTLGDIIYNVRSFWTLQRSGPGVKAPEQLRGFGNPVARDVPPGGQYQDWRLWQDERHARLALYTGWAYSAINKIGMASLSSDLLIWRRKGTDVEEIKNHPLEMVFQSPNLDMSREYLWLHTIYSLYLRAAYWFLYPDSQGNIAEIWPMPFTRVRPLPDMSPNPERLFAGFIYTFQSGEEVTVPVDNVVYLRFPDPFDVYAPLPPLRAAARPVVLDNAQSDWNTNLFDEGKGMPASIMSVPAELSDDQFRRVKQELRENVGKRMVIRSGTIDVEFAQESHKEMEFLAGREFNRKEIYEVMGVPLETNKETWRWFLDNTVWPVLNMLDGQITTQLVSPYFGKDIFAGFEDIRPQDRSLAVQEATQYWPSMTENETREERGLTPLPPLMIRVGDTELNAYDDVPLRILDKIMPSPDTTTTNTTASGDNGFAGPPSMAGSAGSAHAQKQEDREAAGVEDIAGEMEPEQPEETADVKALRNAMVSWQEIAVKRIKAGKAAHVYLDDSIPEERSYELATILGHCRSEAEVTAVFEHLDEYNNLKATLADRGGEIPQIQFDLEDDFLGPMKEWLEEQAKRIAQASAEGNIPPASFWADENKELRKFLTSSVDKWGQAGISETITSLTKMSLGVDATVNARVAEWAGRYALELATNLNGTTKELVRGKIKQWLLTGKPLPELEASLTEVVAPAWRASLIASTEVTRSFAEVNLEIANELEIILGVIWNTAHDEIVCPTCGPLDGTMRPKEPGAVFPGGFRAPPAHPRCRCGLSFSL